MNRLKRSSNILHLVTLSALGQNKKSKVLQDKINDNGSVDGDPELPGLGPFLPSSQDSMKPLQGMHVVQRDINQHSRARPERKLPEIWSNTSRCAWILQCHANRERPQGVHPQEHRKTSTRRNPGTMKREKMCSHALLLPTHLQGSASRRLKTKIIKITLLRGVSSL